MAGTGKSVMKHAFSQVPRAEIPRSRFNRSHGIKTTFDAGFLVPVYVDEVLPGDTFSLNMSIFARLATPLHPFMDNMFMDLFFFFVPNRLVWSNFKKFFGEQDNPADSTSYLVPTMTSTAGTGYGEQSIHDYFGIPTKKPGLVHMSLAHRAYNKIWNEWFRDQNLQNSVVVDMGDGPDLPTNYVLLRRGKRHDYFTSCLPWPQKGPAVQLPLGNRANVLGIGPISTSTYGGPTANVRQSDGSQVTFTKSMSTRDAAKDIYIRGQTIGPNDFPDIYADLSTATAATINQLRQAFQIQRVYERDARGGTRYTELIQAHFGVTSPDARLQRTEYLGGGSVPFNINPIAQTQATGASGTTTPQGNLAAFGTLAKKGVGFSKSFTEHGLIIGLASLRADLNYQEGLNRMFSRSTRFDYYWPALAHIGEQAVLNKEIYAVGTSGGGTVQDAATFGYQERYAEYRYKPSIITGQFRSNSTTPLDTWHLASYFNALPVLNATFIEENPPIDRVIAVPSEPHVLFDAYVSLHCARPMPVYSVPGLIDHF